MWMLTADIFTVVTEKLSDSRILMLYLPMEGFLTTFFCASTAGAAGSLTEFSAVDVFVSSDILKDTQNFPL